MNLTILAIIAGYAVGSAFMGFQLWTAFRTGTIRSAMGQVLTRREDRIDFWLYVALAVAWFAGLAMVLVLTAVRLLGPHA